jgi:ubiquinone/menaquinone biosynthesis C-methylase UbiE
VDARLVWDTWRQILRDDRLVDMVTHAGLFDDAAAAALGERGMTIASDYARTPKATSTNVGMYRRGLSRIALVALGRVPLSQRLLFASGLDCDDVTSGFVRARGHVDDGPNFWRLADAFVAYLETRPEFSSAAHRDVLAIDRTLAALAQRLGDAAVPAWPDAAAADPVGFEAAHHPGRRYTASRAAAIASSRHDLTAWIEDPHGFDPDQALPPSSRHWLVYFPAAECEPAYAELSERSARMFDELLAPRTALEAARAIGDLSEEEALTVIQRLAALGVVVGEAGEPLASGLPPLSTTLADDMFVSMDPAVEMLDGEFAEHRLLCHGHFGIGMAIPPGDGLADFIGALSGDPVCVGTLRRGFDDQRLVETMLCALRHHGFLHVTGPERPAAGALALLRRAAARQRRAGLCQVIELDMETTSPGAIRDLVEAEATVPELHLRCARLADHVALLEALALQRRAGQLRLHRVLVRAADIGDAACAVPALLGLGAELTVDGVPYPAPPQAIAGLDVLASACVPVHARMVPDRTLLDPSSRRQARSWAASVFLTGLELVIDSAALWPTGSPGPADFAAVFEAVHELEEALGDVSIANLPSDEVLLGNTAPGEPGAMPDVMARLRLAYLRWRLPLLKVSEGDNTFSQTPEAEEKLVRLREDLLPNHPELLQAHPGGILVDVCGGNGRVARRLSPLVGPDGLVVSVEMLRCVSDRARRFACELGFANVQFRTGLAGRLPLPDGVADAAVNEWTGAIWQLGLGPTMLAEMARVVRVGGRVAVTHRLVRLPLARLDQPWVQFGDIHALMQEAFAQPGLRLVSERVWGQTVQSLAGENATAWRKHYLPRVVNPFDVIYTEDRDPGPHADVCLTLIAERVQ